MCMNIYFVKHLYNRLEYMSEKIMVVDDEPDVESMIRQHFRKNVKEGEFQFVFAHNGLEALSKLIEHPDITIILSDLNMTEMDGLTLLARINELRKPYLTTVIVSAYGDMDNVRAAMNRGAYDFLTKPVNLEILELTIRKTIADLEESRKKDRELSHNKILEQSNEIAHGIQQSILPKVFPPFPYKKEFEIFAKMIPAKDPGSDFYDYFIIDKEQLGFVVASVSGNGLPASIYMAISRTFLRAVALKGSDPATCLKQVNNLLYHQSKENKADLFLTAFYAVFNYKTGALNYSFAGDFTPCLINETGNITRLKNTGNPPLGTVRNYYSQNLKIMINKNDSVFVFTKGLNYNAENDVCNKLKDAIVLLKTNTPELFINEIFSKINEFIDSNKKDMTLLALKYLSSPNN